MTADEAVQAAIDFELEKRKTLKAMLPYALDSRPPASSPAVEFGRNLVRLAASARVARIMRSDLPAAAGLAEALQDQTALTIE